MNAISMASRYVKSAATQAGLVQAVQQNQNGLLKFGGTSSAAEAGFF